MVGGLWTVVRGRSLVKIGAEKLVSAIVTFSDEPSTAWQVVPPLLFNGGLAVPVKHIIGPRFVVHLIGIGRFAELAAEMEFLRGTRAVNGTVDDFHDLGIS